jgi:tetratricopeptide (TPR) repeat protein
MSSSMVFKPRGAWNRVQRSLFVALAVAGILFFLMRDTVAHRVVQVDTTGAVAAEGEGKPNLPAQWLTNLDAAKAKAAETNKPVLAVFSTSWCGPCQMMVRDIYPQPEVIAALNNWVPVYVDGDVYTDLVSQYEVPGFPTFIVMNAKGEEQGRFVGGAGSPKSFLTRLDTAVGYDEKLAAAEKAVEAAPGDAKALHRLGDLKMAAVDDGDSFMEAVQVYKKAIAANPDDLGNIDPELASLLKDSVLKERQIEDVTAQIGQSPNDATLYKKRGDLYADDPMTQDGSKALADYQRAVELDPENVTGAAGDLKFFDLRSRMSGDNVDPVALIAELKEFEVQNPKSNRMADALILRAYLNLQTGSMEEGTATLKSLIERYPDHEAAEAARGLLEEIAGANTQMAPAPPMP